MTGRQTLVPADRGAPVGGVPVVGAAVEGAAGVVDRAGMGSEPIDHAHLRLRGQLRRATGQD